MRLLFFGDAGSIHTARWCRWFAKEGHSVWLATDREPEEPISDVELLQLGGHGLPSPLRFAFRLRQARHWGAKVRPDLAHGHYLQQYGYLAAGCGAPSYALSAWGSDVLRLGERGAIHTQMTRSALRDAALVTVDSLEVHETVVKLGASPERVLDVVFGVDFSSLAQADPHALRQELGIPASGFVALHMRNLEPLYRPLVVVRAMVSAARACDDFYGLIVGAGSLNVEVRREAQAAERVIVLPRQPEAKVASFFAAADAFVSIPESDATSVSLLQAMAAGSVPVVSDLPANHAWIKSGITGTILEASSDEQLRLQLEEALRTLATDRRRAAALGTAAQQLPALKATDFDAQMRTVERAYDSIVQARR